MATKPLPLSSTDRKILIRFSFPNKFKPAVAMIPGGLSAINSPLTQPHGVSIPAAKAEFMSKAVLLLPALLNYIIKRSIGAQYHASLSSDRFDIQ